MKVVALQQQVVQLQDRVVADKIEIQQLSAQIEHIQAGAAAKAQSNAARIEQLQRDKHAAAEQEQELQHQVKQLSGECQALREAAEQIKAGSYPLLLLSNKQLFRQLRRTLSWCIRTCKHSCSRLRN